MTAHFSQFPRTTFNKSIIKDVSIRLDFVTRIKNNLTLYQYEDLKDGERPEDIALKFYGDPELFWVVLYINDKVDPFYDWLLTEEHLNSYITRKYGAENINAVHHYETTANSDLGAGVIVSSTEDFSVPVTNYEYEKAKNEEKRKIKILKNKYLQQVLTEYKNELRNR